MRQFRIGWTLEDSEWEKAQALEHADNVHYTLGEMAMFDLLYGEVQLTYGSRELFPPQMVLDIMRRRLDFDIQRGKPAYPLPQVSELDGITLSLVDLAVQLARILDQGFIEAPEGSRVAFQGSDDPRDIFFEKRLDEIEITTNLFTDGPDRPTLIVPSSTFLEDVRRFLTEFAREVNERVPGMFEWDVFSPLRPYRSQT